MIDAFDVREHAAASQEPAAGSRGGELVVGLDTAKTTDAPYRKVGAFLFLRSST